MSAFRHPEGAERFERSLRRDSSTPAMTPALGMTTRDVRRPLRATCIRVESRLMLKAVLFDLDDTLLPDESAANEALVATAAVAKAWHNIPPGDLKDSVRIVARRIFRANPVVAAHGNVFDISSWEALCSSFEGDDNERKQLRDWTPTFRSEVSNQALCE